MVGDWPYGQLSEGPWRGHFSRPPHCANHSYMWARCSTRAHPSLGGSGVLCPVPSSLVLL